LSEVFEANRNLFATRFPDLACLIGLDSASSAQSLLASVPERYSLAQTPSGQRTLSVGGTYLHSKYNPVRDAERALADPSAAATFSASGCVFAGLGLAYTGELYAKKFPDSTLVLIEPDIYLFLLCLASRNLESLLSHRTLVLIVGEPARDACALIERLGLQNLPVHSNAGIRSANRGWFEEFDIVSKRNRDKREINANTLKKFGDLWLGNMCKNLNELRDRRGITGFAGLFDNVPSLILAAGPSLDRILPSLKALREKCVIIAVDTAVRACVRAGVEPDFIVLVDPQYWNWRHLDGVISPSSILITESAAWPAVFRFQCRGIYLCSSLFPLGKFLEERTEARGELGAGGSVSTTAWDFARHLGSKKIYMAGLDLGFPDRKTHFTGSIFEDRTHTVSGRLSPSETAGYLALYGAGPYPVPDYRGGSVLTDKRLILYAWWFESRLALYPEYKTATLTDEGVRIPGFSVARVEDIFALENRRTGIDATLESVLARDKADAGSITERLTNERFDKALAELQSALDEIGGIAERGMRLCDSCKNGIASEAVLAQLDEIDGKILSHPGKEIVAMVFTENKPDESKGALDASKAMYRQIRLAVSKNIEALDKKTVKI
jgi:hypothetical protein